MLQSLVCNCFIIVAGVDLAGVDFTDVDLTDVDTLCLQVISGSHDCTVRLWDLAMGRTRVTLTNHKKSVRALALHPVQ